MKMPCALVFLSFLSLMSARLIGAPDVPGTPDQALEHNWNAIEKAGDKLGPRQLVDFMLEAVPLQWHPERVDEAMTKLQQLQDSDPTSKTYGNFRWYQWQPKPVDLNAVEFTMQKATLLWNLYRDNLSPQSRNLLSVLINLSVEGINRHKVPVEYTNIFVMKTWNSIAIGEAFQRKDVAEKGYAMLQQWMDEIYHHGVHEYLSPTYTGVDLDSLALLEKYAGWPEARASAEKALQFLYWQCRANMFAPDQRLGGSHSRDYDYLLGHGYLDRYLADWGWIADFKSPVLHTFTDLTTWKPADSLTYPEASVTPRFTWQRWGALPEQCATQYIGPTLSIGADGTSYSMEDKVFTINFDGGPKMVMVNFFMDGRGDPYGQNKVMLSDGHVKAHHLMPFTVSAQDGPNVLFFSSFGGSPQPKKQEPPVCLNSHLDLPVEASVWQGDNQLAVSSGQQAVLASNEPVFLRYKNAVVGFHFEATDDAGKPISPVYYRDGDQFNAARISWTHAASTPKGEAHVIFWAKAGENLDDDGFAKFRADFAHAKVDFNFANGKLAAHVQADAATSLSMEADLAAGTRKTNTPDFPGIFQVNGKEIGQAILGSPHMEPQSK
ncbi:MAG: hypothetical protein LV481_14345 [Methylacidiphilales bacterium]|nr:hypothetical protein [Candidatus Methylacidiphilales bacterium]